MISLRNDIRNDVRKELLVGLSVSIRQAAESGAEAVLPDEPRREPVETPAAEVVGPETAHYSMSRGITTVGEVWQEYTVGLNGPSIRSLEANLA